MNNPHTRLPAHAALLIPLTNTFGTQQGNRPQQYQSLLTLGNHTMLAALITTLVATLIAYIFPEPFSISTQVVAHIIMLLAATAIKIGYLIRCIGRQGIGAKIS